MGPNSLDGFVEFISDSSNKIFLSWPRKEEIKKSRFFLKKTMKQGDIYGVTSGVGALLDQKISLEKNEEFQRNLIASHACGVGSEFFPELITRGAFFLLINNLKKGFTGVSLETVERLVELYNLGIVPSNIPKIGSVGDSGDLVPLAHLILSLVDNYELKIKSGEGIFLINGTHFTTSSFGQLVFEAQRLIRIANLAVAMVVTAVGKAGQFSRGLSYLKFYEGYKICEKELRDLLVDNFSVSNVVQDPYSLRCAPLVHGAVYDVVQHGQTIFENELRSVSSNPVVFADREEICSGCCFHSMPMAFAADSLGVALTALSVISERRIERMLNTALSKLPAFLSPNPGLHSGLMITQYPVAALGAKNKVLANPASVHSVPVSAGQEDFVSMAPTAIAKVEEIAGNTKKILAIEILCACQALDLQGDIKKMRDCLLKQRWQEIRAHVPFLNKDRSLTKDIAKIVEIIKRW